MTTLPLMEGTPVAYVAPDGITYQARFLYTNLGGSARIEVPELRRRVDVDQRWLSDLTPTEQARLREVRQ
jgi:hypothetical protein